MITMLQHLNLAHRIQRYLAVLVAQRNLLDGNLTASCGRLANDDVLLLVDGAQHYAVDAFADAFDYAIPIGSGLVAHRHGNNATN